MEFHEWNFHLAGNHRVNKEVGTKFSESLIKECLGAYTLQEEQVIHLKERKILNTLFMDLRFK